MGLILHLRVEKLKNCSEPVSLEAPIGEEDDSHLGDFLKIKILSHQVNTQQMNY